METRRKLRHLIVAVLLACGIAVGVVLALAAQQAPRVVDLTIEPMRTHEWQAMGPGAVGNGEYELALSLEVQSVTPADARTGDDLHVAVKLTNSGSVPYDLPIKPGIVSGQAYGRETERVARFRILFEPEDGGPPIRTFAVDSYGSPRFPATLMRLNPGESVVVLLAATTNAAARCTAIAAVQYKLRAVMSEFTVSQGPLRGTPEVQSSNTVDLTIGPSLRAELAGGADAGFLDLPLPQPRPGTGVGWGSGGGMAGAEFNAVLWPAIAVRLLSVDHGYCEIGQPITWEMVVMNTSAKDMLIPWTGDESMRPERLEWVEARGYVDADLWLIFKSPNGPNSVIASRMLHGLKPLPNTVKILQPGQSVRIRATAPCAFYDRPNEHTELPTQRQIFAEFRPLNASSYDSCNTIPLEIRPRPPAAK